MAERAILTGLVALVLLTALVKMGPSLSSSFDQVGAVHQTTDPNKAIDYSRDEDRAAQVLEEYKADQVETEDGIFW